MPNKNVIIYYCGFLSVLLFTYLVLYGNYFKSSLVLFASLAIITAIFASFKYGFYGPYYLLLILIPFSQSITVFTMAGRPVNLGLHTMVIFAILVLTIWKEKGRFPVLKEKATSILFLLGIWAGLTIFVSMLFVPASGLSNSIVTWVRWIQFLPIAYFLVYSPNILIHFKKFINLFIILGFIVSIWGIYEVLNPTEFSYKAFRGAVTFTKPIFRETDPSKAFSLKGGFYFGSANYNIAGAFMAVITLIAIPFILKIKLFRSKIIPYSLILLLTIGLILTQSRSAIIAFIIGLLFYAKSISRKKLLLSIVGVVTCITLAFIYLNGKVSFVSMIVETISNFPKAASYALKNIPYDESMGFTTNAYGAAVRLVGIKEAFFGFLDNPFFGGGFFTFSGYFPKMGTSENFYMQILFETGFIGLFLLVWYIYRIWRYTKTEFEQGSFAQKYQRGFRSALVVFIIVNSTGTLFYDTRIWGLMIVLSAIQIRLVREKELANK